MTVDRTARPPRTQLTLREVAEGAGVSEGTLRRWARDGVIPQYVGEWTPTVAASVRIVARLRARGHTLEEIREAGRSGRLVTGFIDELVAASEATTTLAEAAREADLAPALIERLFSTLGYSSGSVERLSEDDMRLLRSLASVLRSGFPLVALLQLTRVYSQALAQIADAEVRLFHLYVHEPLMRDGVPGLEMAEQMEGLARELLPLSSPFMDLLHQRFLAHFVEQDVVGHMESDLDGEALDLGRLRVAIAFADLAGYTRLTEEQGDEEAVDAVERFVSAVEATLPDDARIIKTIGDEVMVVGSDAAALTDWAVAFQERTSRRPLPRIGLHYGETIYRDGDYYGREVNQAARVAARAAAGEVLVTRPVVDAAGAHLAFAPIGEVKLKGFATATELFIARSAPGR